MTPEMEALKARLKSMWMAGDYGHFAKFLELGAMEFFLSSRSLLVSVFLTSRAARGSSHFLLLKLVPR